MGLSSKSDGVRGADGGLRGRSEGRDFLLVMDSLERRLEDLRSSGGALGRGACKNPADTGRCGEVRSTNLDEAMADLERSRTTAKATTEQESTLQPQGQQETGTRCNALGSDASCLDDNSETDFFRMRLRQLRAENLAEGQGETCGHSRLSTSFSERGVGEPSSCRRRAMADRLRGTLTEEPLPAPRIPRDSEASQLPPAMADQAAERVHLRNQLFKAESDLERLSHSVDLMRRNHDSQIAALRAESGARARSHAAERESLKSEAAAAVADSRMLKRALAEERRRSTAALEKSLQVRHNQLPTTPQDVAPIIAGLEVEALRQADEDMRARLKKKLQLKWHPDKCINAALAKCVMQELQQRPEWQALQSYVAP